MKVFIVIEQVEYEGDDILSLWANEENAKKEVEKLLEENKEYVKEGHNNYIYEIWEIEDK